MAVATSSPPEQGQLVPVRQRRYVVTDVAKSTLPEQVLRTSANGSQHLVSLSLCLLDNDPSVIEPDVLSKDRTKFEETGDQKYVDKAHRRDKVGWNVGRQIEVSPHYRRPHMMLAWTGPGRSVPKIVPRRGTIVHRQKVEKIPTGREGNSIQ